MNGCVIDASSVLAWCFEDEGGPEADALIEHVAAANRIAAGGGESAAQRLIGA